MTNFDIIIPTYNRPAYLRRILDYYDSFGENLDIIVADSSSNENRKLNRDTIASVSKANIQYLDHYSTKINPHHKFADVVNYARKKYCVFCADDDFITLNGIEQSVDFLEKNPDFSVAQGQYIGFRVRTGEGKKQRFLWKFADPAISIEFPDPEARLEYHMSNYFTSTVYGVHRSDALKMVYNEFLKSEADPFLFGELLPTMLTIIYGKMKCLNVLYGARDTEPVMGRTWPTLRDAIETGTFDEKYVKFRDCLAGHLSKNSRLGIEESGKLVDKAMSAYLHKHILRPVVPTSKSDTVPVPKSKQRIFLDSLHLPDWMDKGITTSYNALFNKPVSMPPEYHNDFNKIRLQVLSHSRTADTETVKSSVRS